MKGWVGLVGWPVADGLPTLLVTHQLQVERRTGKVRRPETDVLPLCHATNQHAATVRSEMQLYTGKSIFNQRTATSRRPRPIKRSALWAFTRGVNTTARRPLTTAGAVIRTQFPGNEHKYAMQYKKYKNQAGINLTPPPPPSQNSHAVRWHCTAEWKRWVAEIKTVSIIIAIII